MDDLQGPLSQSEIDALLKALNNPTDVAPPQGASSMPETESEPEPEASMLPVTGPEKEPSTFLHRDWARLQDLTLHVQVEIGNTEITVKDWLKQGIGSRLELNEQWKRPVNIQINGRTVGSGQVVLVGNRFGIKVLAWGNRR